MAHVIFYEKAGCAGNARQKALLVRAGHTLEVRDLLGTLWTREALLQFLDGLPVSDWFNRAAPRVKSGEVQPDALSRAEALALLLADPLLVRRPLLQVGQHREVGFLAAVVQEWIGLEPVEPEEGGDLEGCAGAGPGGCGAHGPGAPAPVVTLGAGTRR